MHCGGQQTAPTKLRQEDPGSLDPITLPLGSSWLSCLTVDLRIVAIHMLLTIQYMFEDIETLNGTHPSHADISLDGLWV